MSTQTVTEDTITEMEKYNFHNPLNVTIVFDECEEDNDCQELHGIEDSTTHTNGKANNKNNNTNVHDKLINAIKKTSYHSNKIKKNRVNTNDKRKSKQNKGLEQTGIIRNSSLTQTHNNNHMEFTTMHLTNNPRLNQCHLPSQQNNIDMMLNHVAKNMISIMEAYTNYYKIFNNSVDSLTSECSDRLRTNYLRIKYYYFNKSQTISELILLPQERNKCFMESFLFRTILMAKGKMNISYNNLRTLYVDLLEWTKQKQENSLRLLKENQNMNNIQPLLRVLPPSKSVSQNVSNHIRRPESESQTKGDKIKVFSSGPPGNEITISVDPKFLTPKTHHVPTQYRTTCLNEMQSINHNVQTSVPSSDVMSCNAQASIGYNNNPIKNIQERRTDTQILLEDPFAKYSSQPPVVYQDNMQSKVAQRKSNEYERNKQTDSQDATRCSISRDSGFMSPIIFNPSSEPTYDLIRDQCTSKTTSMTVSNVTTFMSNTTNASLGLCQVCGKITKLMCVGCYKLYYCSEACQSADWNVHKIVCYK